MSCLGPEAREWAREELEAPWEEDGPLEGCGGRNVEAATAASGPDGGEGGATAGSESSPSSSTEEEDEMVPNWRLLRELGERVFARLEARGIDPLETAPREELEALGLGGGEKEREGGGGLREARAREEEEEIEEARREMEEGVRGEVERLTAPREAGGPREPGRGGQGAPDPSRRWRGLVDPPGYGGESRMEGPMWGFGNNCQGALGTARDLPEPDEEDEEVLRNPPVDQYLPTACLGLGEGGVACVGAGRGHTVVAMRDGSVLSSGWNDCGQLGLGHCDVEPANYRFQSVPPGEMGRAGARAKQVVCGDEHSVVVLDDGSAWGWGSDEEGQIGLGGGGGTVHTPTRITFGPTAWPSQEVESAAAGGAHTVFLLRSGQVFACGRNLDGQLGLGRFSRVEWQEDPTPLVERLLGARRGERVPEAVRGGELQVTVGAVRSPEEVRELRRHRGRVLQVACGRDSTLALLEGSLLLAFGANDHAQLGIGAYKPHQCTPQLVPLASPSPVKSLWAGPYHTFVQLEDLSVWAFGCNDGGQLGTGDREGLFEPARVATLDGTRVRQAACGEEHTLFLLEPGPGGGGGDVLVCGRHHCGQLGVGVPLEGELVLPPDADEGDDVRFFGERPPLLAPERHEVLSGRVEWLAAGTHTSFAVPIAVPGPC